MRRALVVSVLVGCGRVAFDPLADASRGDALSGPDAPAMPLCFEDTFDDADISDWTTAGEWSALPGGLAAGSFMLHNDVLGPIGATHPDLLGIEAGILSFDLQIDNAAAGDGQFHFLTPGWTSPTDDSKYRVALYPVGSDNPTDNIRRVVRPTNTTLVSTPTRIAGSAWHRIEIRFARDHAIDVFIDDALHMQSGPDAVLTGPFDVVFDFFDTGGIDNVRLFCER